MIHNVGKIELLNGIVKDLVQYCIKYSVTLDNSIDDYDYNLSKVLDKDDYECVIEACSFILSTMR